MQRQDFSLTVLKGKMADLEEAAEELKELKERKATDKVGPLQAKLEKAEKMMEERKKRGAVVVFFLAFCWVFQLW